MALQPYPNLQLVKQNEKLCLLSSYLVIPCQNMYHGLTKLSWYIPPKHTKKVLFCISSKHKWSEFVMLKCSDPLFWRDHPCVLHAKVTISQLHSI